MVTAVKTSNLTQPHLIILLVCAAPPGSPQPGGTSLILRRLIPGTAVERKFPRVNLVYLIFLDYLICSY
jgi:hypothetical protein